MRVENREDDVNIYINMYQNGGKILVNEAILFSWDDTLQEQEEVDFCGLSIWAFLPIYITKPIKEIKNSVLSEYDLSLCTEKEFEDLTVTVNAIKVDIDKHGILQSIIFPTLAKLAVMYGDPKFGKYAHTYHGRNTSDWLYNVYREFLTVLSKFIVSGEMVSSLYTEYFDGISENDEVTDYIFYARNNIYLGPTLHHEHNALIGMQNLYKHFSHTFATPDMSTKMDLYNVF